MKAVSYLVPILILALIIYATIKKVNVYQAFTDGVKSSLKLVFDIFPYVATMLIMVSALNESGITYALIDLLSPFFSFLGIPAEILPLMIIKPFSGSGSLALLGDIYKTYGVDSYVSKCASVVFGSSETVFYISAIYLCKCKNKRITKAIIISLVSIFSSIIFGCLLCKFM